MRITVDLDTNKVISGPGVNTEVTELSFKRQPAAKIEVQFSRNGEVIELDADAAGIFGVKRTDKFDEDYVTSALFWTKTGAGSTTVYSLTISLINAVLDGLFFVDGDPSNDVKRLTLMAELQWITLGNTFKTPTLVVTIDNDVIREYDITAPDFIFDDTDPGDPELMLGDDNQPLLNG